MIPLDPTLSATENAKKYFERYGKLKRTAEALATLTEEVKEQINHLESILDMFFLDIVDFYFLLSPSFGVVGCQAGGFLKGAVGQFFRVFGLYQIFSPCAPESALWEIPAAPPP